MLRMFKVHDGELATSSAKERAVSWRQTEQPVQGWNTRRAYMNPRPPAVPATMDITLEEYFSAAAVMGLLAAQIDQPDPEWASEWALKFGTLMAEKARKRRGKRRRT